MRKETPSKLVARLKTSNILHYKVNGFILNIGLNMCEWTRVCVCVWPELETRQDYTTEATILRFHCYMQDLY